jgi:hypothetical protein
VREAGREQAAMAPYDALYCHSMSIENRSLQDALNPKVLKQNFSCRVAPALSLPRLA